MARSQRRPELWLLLAVAPFFMSCDDGGPEERHCVGPDGRYLEDLRCEPGGPYHHAGAHYVYVPHSYYGGPGASAGAFRGATTPGSGHATISRGGFGSHGAAHGHGGA